MTGLLASIIASLAAWLVELLLGKHISETADYVVSFVVGSVVFVASYVWIKRMRDQL